MDGLPAYKIQSCYEQEKGKRFARYFRHSTNDYQENQTGCCTENQTNSIKDSLCKTDGTSGLHDYISLDSKSNFETSKNVAESICKLIRLKIPNVVTLNGPEDHGYGKVLLDYLVNEQGKSIVAPYSIVPAQGQPSPRHCYGKKLKKDFQLRISTLQRSLKGFSRLAILSQAFSRRRSMPTRCSKGLR